VDLHPFPFQGMDGAISGGAVTLYLGMIAHIMVIFAAHKPLEDMKVTYEHRIAAQIVHLLVGTFFLSFFPAISVVWFGASLSGAKFFQVWAMFGLGMTAMGSFITMNYHIFGKRAGGIANLIIFGLNQAASGTSLPLELQHPFFHIGMGLPYYQIIVGLRAILYGCESVPFRRAVGVCFAWIGVAGIGALRLMVRRRRVAKAAHVVKSLVTHSYHPRNARQSPLHQPYLTYDDADADAESHLPTHHRDTSN
jgi:hypothetical protein